MKKLLFLIGIFPLIVFGQDVTPKIVENTFNNMFALAEDVLWTQLDEEFEASFYIEEEYKLALFSKEGKWIETATSINVEEASSEITKPIYKKFKGAGIDNIFIVETPKKVKFYRLQVDDGESVYMIKMSEVYEIIESKKITFSLVEVDEDEEEIE